MRTLRRVSAISLIVLCLFGIAAATATAANAQTMTNFTVASFNAGTGPVTGKVCLRATDAYGNSISVAVPGVAFYLKDRPFCQNLNSGAMAGTLPVPNSANDSSPGHRYDVVVYDTVNNLQTDLGPIPGVQGTTWALDTYVPTISMPTAVAFTYTVGTSDPIGACAPPALYDNSVAHTTFHCFSGSWSIELPPVGTTAGTVAAGNDARILAAMKNKGTYAAGTSYDLNDVVNSGSVTYLSLAANNQGNTPVLSPSFWSAIGSASTPGSTATQAGTTYSLQAADCAANTPSISFTSSTGVAVSLPTTGLQANCLTRIKNLGGVNATITLTPVSGTIDGGVSLPITYPGDGVIQWDGTTWKAYGGYGVRGASNLPTPFALPYVLNKGTLSAVSGAGIPVYSASAVPSFLPVGVANGVATLDGTTKLSHAWLPSLLSTDMPSAVPYASIVAGLGFTPAPGFGIPSTSGVTVNGVYDFVQCPSQGTTITDLSGSGNPILIGTAGSDGFSNMSCVANKGITTTAVGQGASLSAALNSNTFFSFLVLPVPLGQTTYNGGAVNGMPGQFFSGQATYAPRFLINTGSTNIWSMSPVISAMTYNGTGSSMSDVTAGPHVLSFYLGTASAGTCTVYIDAAPTSTVCTGVMTGNSTSGHFTLCASAVSGYTGVNCQNMYFVNALTASGVIPATFVQQVYQYQMSLAAQDGVVLQPTATRSVLPNVNMVGDSLTACYQFATPASCPSKTITTKLAFNLINYGISGITASQTLANTPYREALTADSQTGQSISRWWLETNDAALSSTATCPLDGTHATGGTIQTFAALVWSRHVQWARVMHRLGQKTYVMPMISRGPNGSANPVCGGYSFENFKDAYNPILYAQYANVDDGVADVADIPGIGPDNSYSNTTHFAADQTHVIYANDEAAIATMEGNTIDWISAGSTKANCDPTPVTAATYTMVAADGCKRVDASAAPSVVTLMSASGMVGRIVSVCNTTLTGTNGVTVHAPADLNINYGSPSAAASLTVPPSSTTTTSISCKDFRATRIDPTSATAGTFWQLIN